MAQTLTISIDRAQTENAAEFLRYFEDAVGGKDRTDETRRKTRVCIPDAVLIQGPRGGTRPPTFTTYRDDVCEDVDAEDEMIARLDDPEADERDDEDREEREWDDEDADEDDKMYADGVPLEEYLELQRLDSHVSVNGKAVSDYLAEHVVDEIESVMAQMDVKAARAQYLVQARKTFITRCWKEQWKAECGLRYYNGGLPLVEFESWYCRKFGRSRYGELDHYDYLSVFETFWQGYGLHTAARRFDARKAPEILRELTARAVKEQMAWTTEFPSPTDHLLDTRCDIQDELEERARPETRTGTRQNRVRNKARNRHRAWKTVRCGGRGKAYFAKRHVGVPHAKPTGDSQRREVFASRSGSACIRTEAFDRMGDVDPWTVHVALASEEEKRQTTVVRFDRIEHATTPPPALAVYQPRMRVIEGDGARDHDPIDEVWADDDLGPYQRLALAAGAENEPSFFGRRN